MTNFDQEGGAGAAERRDSQTPESGSRWSKMLPFLVALGRPVQLVRFDTHFIWMREILTCYLDAFISYTLLGWLRGEGFWRRLRKFSTCLFEFIKLITFERLTLSVRFALIKAQYSREPV